MRNEGKKNERRSTPPSFGILLLPRQIGSEHVLHHKLPSKQTKRKKDGFQWNKLILVIIAFTKQKKKQHSKDFLSFSFSLSLLGKNTLSKKAHFVQCTHITAFSNRLRCIIIVSIITFHQKGEREREIRDLSRARTAREQLKRAWERYETKKTPSSSYSYLKLTHIIIIRWNQSRRTAHKRFNSFNNHRQSKSTPPFHSFYSQAL